MRLLCVCAVALLVCGAGCGEDGPALVGLWGGQTSGCAVAADDGQSIMVSVVNGPDSPDGDERAMVVTPLGKATGDTLSCRSEGAAVDGYREALTFTDAQTCDDGAYSYTVSITLGGAGTATGTVRYGEAGECALNLRRVE